jgi:PKD repeat protein
VISHTYNDCGFYDVRLTVTTECGSHSLTLGDLIKVKSSKVTKEVGAGYSYTSIQEAINDDV